MCDAQSMNKPVNEPAGGDGDGDGEGSDSDENEDEDEDKELLVTWLEYRIEDTIEKNCNCGGSDDSKNKTKDKSFELPWPSSSSSPSSTIANPNIRMKIQELPSTIANPNIRRKIQEFPSTIANPHIRKKIQEFPSTMANSSNIRRKIQESSSTTRPSSSSLSVDETLSSDFGVDTRDVVIHREVMGSNPCRLVNNCNGYNVPRNGGLLQRSRSDNGTSQIVSATSHLSSNPANRSPFTKFRRRMQPQPSSTASIPSRVAKPTLTNSSLRPFSNVPTPPLVVYPPKTSSSLSGWASTTMSKSGLGGQRMSTLSSMRSNSMPSYENEVESLLNLEPSMQGLSRAFWNRLNKAPSKMPKSMVASQTSQVRNSIPESVEDKVVSKKVSHPLASCRSQSLPSRSRSQTLPNLDSLVRKISDPTILSSQVSSGCDSFVTEETMLQATTSDNYMSSGSTNDHRCVATQRSGSISSSTMITSDCPMTMVGVPHNMGPRQPTLASSYACSQASVQDVSSKDDRSKGKHKDENSECHNEECVDDESIEIKQPQRTSSLKRNRDAKVHNLSERNRRNRINEKLKALQDLIPNSTKADKASVLDEAIEYMKRLQMQLQMVSMRSGMSVSPLMIPVTMPHLQMGPIPNMGLGVPIGHPNMGNMGNMCMDMSMRQGANQFKNPYGNGCGTTSKLGCQVSSSDEFPVESTPMEHNSPQVSTKLPERAYDVVQLHQSQEQEQHLFSMFP